MTTENDHISNLVRRLIDKKKIKEGEIAEIEMAIQGLQAVNKVLSGNDNMEYEPKKYPERGYIIKEVRAYVDKLPKGAEIKIGEIKKEMHYKDSAIRSALMKLVREKITSFTAGIGFHKIVDKEDKYNQLVYDSENNAMKKGLDDE